MPDIDEKLTAQLGYSPFLDSALIQFDQQILLATQRVRTTPTTSTMTPSKYSSVSMASMP